MTKKKKKIYQITVNEGDAVIRLRSNKIVELVFAEDEDSIIREVEWPEQEVYKTAVQFALMIDTFFKNGEGLDNLIMHSSTGSIAAELLGKEMLSITLAGLGEFGDADSETEGEEEMEIELEFEEHSTDNVVEASTRFNRKDDNDGKK